MTPAYADMAKPGDGVLKDARLLWMCGHRALSGKYRRVAGLRPIAWRCAECSEKAAVMRAALSSLTAAPLRIETA